MKHLQKSLSLFLCIVMCLSFFPFSAAYAEEAESVEEELILEEDELDLSILQDDSLPEEQEELPVLEEIVAYSENQLESISLPVEEESSFEATEFAMNEDVETSSLASANTATYSKTDDGNYIYSKSSDGICIVQYMGDETSTLEIPSEIEGMPVIRLGEESFKNSKASEIVLPDTLQEICGNAFYYCSAESIIIPASVITIGSEAFMCCNGLTHITIPAGTQSIGDSPFRGCRNLESIEVEPGNSTFSVFEHALINKEDMRLISYPFALIGENFEIPEGIRIIGRTAFGYEGPRNLKNLIIPDSVIEIQSSAFVFSNVETIVIGSGINSMEDAFGYCKSLRTVTIAEGSTSIGRNCFYNCESLITITIPSSVTYIGNEVFGGCYNLTDVFYSGTQEQWNQISIGSNNEALSFSTIHFLSATGTCGAQGNNLTWALYDSGVLVIEGTGAMNDFSSSVTEEAWHPYKEEIKKVVMISGITSIGNGAFYFCRNLNNIIIPEGITTIGDNAFKGCNLLEKIYIPNSVVSIGSECFFKCSSLISVTIPFSVTSISGLPFAECKSLTAIHVDPANPAYCDVDGALYNKNMTNIKQVPGARSGAYVIPDGVAAISYGAFCGCSGLTNVTIPDSVTIIGKGAFNYCSSLTSITIPESVMNIGPFAFDFCSSLIKIHFLGAPPTINSSAFTGVNATAYYPLNKSWTAENMQNYGGSLTWIPVEQDITIIDSGTWGDNIIWTLDDSGLLRLAGNGQMMQPDREGDESVYPWFIYRNTIKKIIVDSGVMGISAYAFGHTAVEEVQLPSGLESIASYAFYQCYNLTTVNFPGSLEYIGSFAFVSTSVKSFTIPVNTYYIGDGALCTNNLESITVKPANTQFVTDINGILYDKSHHDYSNCYTLLACPKTVSSNLHIDDKVSVIAAYAFKGCSDLNSVTTPSNLITVGAFAFTYSGLHEIIFTGPPPAFSDKSFAEVTANAYYPANKGWTAANMKNYGGNLTWIPDSIEQIEQFVRRCYRLLMDREGDSGGVNYWTNELTSGRQGGASIVDQFVSSKEFANKNLSNTETVSFIYRTMLNREPDSGGLAYWQGFLDDGASPHYIVSGFSGAQEFKDLCSSYGINPGKINLNEYRDKNIKVTQFVNRNYKYALERKGEANGLNYWCEQIIKKTQTPKQCANNFVFSKECINSNLSDENFVRMLYNLYMGRTADQGGLNYWTGQLRNGMTRQQVANSFADSPEFRNIVAGYGLL